MKRITLNITDEQSVALKESALFTGIPQSEQIRRALASTICSPASVALIRELLKKEQTVLSGNQAPALPEQKSTTECETLLSLNQAQEIAQKLGKPIEELYERVPAQKSSAEVQLFTAKKESE